MSEKQIDLVLSLSCNACDFAELTTDPQRLDAALIEHEAIDGHRLTVSAPPEADSAELRHLVLNGLLDLLRVLNKCPTLWTASHSCGWVGHEQNTEDEANQEGNWHSSSCHA